MFAGIFIRTSSLAPEDYSTKESLIRALTPYHQADRIGEWESQKVTIVHALTLNTIQSKYEHTPYQCPLSGLVCASWMRIDNRKEIYASLKLEKALHLVSDPMLVVAAYRRWGKACANRLEGDFSFVIYDPKQHKCFAARDSLGTKPFFYFMDKSVFVFASTAAIFRSLKNIDIKPSEQWITRYLVGLSISNDNTAYNNVKKLPPAHFIEVGQSEKAKPTRYFKFQDIAPNIYTRDVEWVDSYRNKFHTAVERRLQSSYLVGAESSGGLDSSTIIAHATKKLWHSKEDFHCFGVCHAAQEPEYILATSMHCGIKHNHILTQPNYDASEQELSRAIDVLGYPPEHSHTTFHTPFYELCENFGIRSLLSGFGGDEMVTHPAGFFFRELLHLGQYRALLRELPGNSAKRATTFLRLILRHKILGNNTPKKISHRRLDNSLLKDDVLKRSGMHEMLTDITLNKENAESLNEFILKSGPWHGRLLGRLEGCALMAGSYKTEYRWPLLDRNLMAQYLNTPSIFKRHGDMGRNLHRLANLGDIPDKILWKESKDMGSLTQLNNTYVDQATCASEMPQILAKLINNDKVTRQGLAIEKNSTTPFFRVNFAPEINNIYSLNSLRFWLENR